MRSVNSPAPDSPDHVWVLMREFVERYSPKEQLLEQLGPKVGSGRGKVYTSCGWPKDRWARGSSPT